MIITPAITLQQQATLAENNLTVDSLLKELIEYKINWMRDRAVYPYNNCSLTIDPSDGSVDLTTGQVNFLKLDFGSDDPPNNDPIANMEIWVQNFIDESVRHLELGEGPII